MSGLFVGKSLVRPLKIDTKVGKYLWNSSQRMSQENSKMVLSSLRLKIESVAEQERFCISSWTLLHTAVTVCIEKVVTTDFVNAG